METKNVNGDVLSNKVFEEKKDLVEAFDKAIDDKEVAEIKVTKMTDTRRKVINKKMRKLERKHAVYRQELQKG